MTRHRRPPAPVERIVPGLERIRAALAEAGNPERTFQAIHVAGTNGKGSTSVVAASILGQLPGAKVGLYTSPHLLSPTERIRIDGHPIPGRELDRLIRRAGALSVETGPGTGEPLSWFEQMTYAAFCWFGKKKVPLAVLETGLGGRWDATTACRPVVTVVTTIGIDHVAWLGHTIKAIAAEKAGIFKPGVPVVLGRIGRAARAVLSARAQDTGSPVWELGRDFGHEPAGHRKIRIRLPGLSIPPIRLKLAGAFQDDNAAVGCAAAWWYAVIAGISPDRFSTAAVKGLSAVSWPGRLSPLPGKGNGGAWVDGAHNPDGARMLANEIASGEAFAGKRPVVALWSMLSDKDIAGFIRQMSPAVDHWVAYPLRHDRAAPLTTLTGACRRVRASFESAVDFGEAWQLARARAGSEGVVIVCGSLVAVADAYSERVGHL